MCSSSCFIHRQWVWLWRAKAPVMPPGLWGFEDWGLDLCWKVCIICKLQKISFILLQRVKILGNTTPKILLCWTITSQTAQTVRNMEKHFLLKSPSKLFFSAQACEINCWKWLPYISVPLWSCAGLFNIIVRSHVLTEQKIPSWMANNAESWLKHVSQICVSQCKDKYAE